MNDVPPGLNSQRLVRLMNEAVRRCELNLQGAAVFTEAASGAYVVTPVLAAIAGAQVTAVTRSTPYGAAEEIARQTLDLAELAGVEPGHLQVTTENSREAIAHADIITNSGHVRPINADLIASMKPTAVVPLMYESWEYRGRDLDLEACERRGIAVAGTNERHPAVDVFAYLGLMAVRLLQDAGIAVHGSRVLVVCDNPFRVFIHKGLANAGASVKAVDSLDAADRDDSLDAVLVAASPAAQPVIGPTDAEVVAKRWPGAVVAQFWGDIDRPALARSRVSFWPRENPGKGHMGILPSELGPEPVVRLQSGGLKVGEILWRNRRSGATLEESVSAAVHAGFGMCLD